MHSILIINGGSSSIKFAFYETGKTLKRSLYGKIDRIGLSGTSLTFNSPIGEQQTGYSVKVSDHTSAARFLINWLKKQEVFTSVKAICSGEHPIAFG